ncbi:MAG: hypothetical protein JW797_13680 [Bradymonadales bacterium]|nr:hypothetical protein [Bradymonadales bacterium]
MMVKRQESAAQQDRFGGEPLHVPQDSRTHFENSLAGLTVQQQQERLTPPRPMVQMASVGPVKGSDKEPWEVEADKFLYADPGDRFPQHGKKIFKDPSYGDYVPTGYLTWDQYKKTELGQREAEQLKIAWQIKHPKVNLPGVGGYKEQPGPTVKKANQKDRSGFNKSLSILDGFTDALTSTKGGAFVSAEFKVDVPIPTVPGLYIQIGTKASYEIDATGMQVLEGEIKLGVSYSLLKVLDIYGGAIGSLKLEGMSLEAAFLDCIKQLTKRALETAGIERIFDDMRRMAKEGPGLTDWLETLIPIYGPTKALQIAVSQIGADGIEQLITAYRAFFVNDTKVGFEVAAGFYGGISLGFGDNEVSVEGQVLVGLKDEIGDTECKGFVEVNGAATFESKGVSVGVKVAKRWLEGGKTAFTVGIESEFPAGGLSQTQAVALGTTFASAAAFQVALGGIAKADQKASFGMAIKQIGAAFLESALVYAVSSALGSRQVGLDIDLTCEDSKWSVDARFKTMTTAKTNMGLVEAKVQVGNYFDISAEFQKMLPKPTPSKNKGTSMAAGAVLRPANRRP